MFILFTVSLLFITALALLLLRWLKPDFRAAWLVAVGGALLAWITVLLWQWQFPVKLTLPAWQPAILFADAPVFLADGLSWPYAFSLVTLALATMLTAISRENFGTTSAWAGILTLTGIGLLAVLADNPLTLVLTWAAIDLAELVIMLRAVYGEKLRERVVVSFATRIAGILFLLWAHIASISQGTTLNFAEIPPQVGPYLLLAAGLRLGVLPVHLPFISEASLHRGFGTALRLTSAASSLALLSRIPPHSITGPWATFLFILTSFAALYGSWMWFRTKKVLNARPYWLIGMGALSIAAALRGNSIGSVAWGSSLILGGGALFLSSVDQKWLTRLLLVGLFGISALPFSLTASGWVNSTSEQWIFWLFFTPAQILLLTGYIQHAQNTKGSSFDSQPKWAQIIYPAGIALPLLVMLALGVWGWQGAQTLGIWWPGSLATFLTIILVWLRPRLRIFNPVQVHWIQPTTSSTLERLYSNLWALYRLLNRLVNFVTRVLESDGGIIWTILFIIVFASMLSGGTR